MKRIRNKVMSVLLLVVMVAGLFAAFPITAMADGDTTAPVISDTISVSATSVQPGDPVTISVEVTDESAITVAYEVSAQQGSSTIAGGTMTWQGGASNTFQRTFTVPANVVNGNYQILVVANDASGNGSNKTFSDAFTVSGGSDDADGPVIDTTLSVSPSTVSPNDTMTISIEVTDVSGVNWVDLYLPMQMSWGYRTSMARQGTSNTYEGTLTVPAYAFNGSYKLQIDASDINGNISNKAFENAFVVTGGAVAPGITGPTTMTLTEGYMATSTSVFTVTGNPTPIVTKETGNAAITWNDTTKKLDIAAGLMAGSYPVELKAESTSGATTFTFTLTVDNAPTAPNIVSPPSYSCVTATGGSYTMTATGTPTLFWSLSSEPSGVTLSGNILNVAATVAPGTYNFTVTVTNAAGSDVKAFTLTVSDVPVAPAITGPTTMTLTNGYGAISTNAYTITGSPTPTVTKESGNAAITWNSNTMKLDIAVGLTPGDYPIVLKAVNGVTPVATITFTLTVSSTPIGGISPTISGPTAMTLTEGYAAASTGVYTVAGNPTPIVTKESGNAAITWNNSERKLEIEAGLSPGSYPIVLKASNGVTPDASITFTLKVVSDDINHPQPVEYPVITNIGSWNGSGSVACKIDAPHSKFVRLLMGGSEIDASNYTVTEGSTVITLKERYLKTLEVGTYTLRAEFTDGYANLSLTVKAQSDNPTDTVTVPKTGDNSNVSVWIIIMFASALALVGVQIWRKRQLRKG